MGLTFKSLSIPKEEARESTTFGTLTTPDEIKELKVPGNGLIRIGYTAVMKSSAANEGRAAIFIGANQLRADKGATTPSFSEVSSKGAAAFHHFTTCPKGLETSATSEWKGDITTGQTLSVGDSLSSGGTCEVYGLPAGTYTVSVAYKALSGTVTAKERRLFVEIPE